MTKNRSKFYALRKTKNFKKITIPILAFASVASLGLQTSAQTATVNPQKPLDMTTLDFLSQQNVTILDSSKAAALLSVISINVVEDNGNVKHISIVQAPGYDNFLTKADIDALATEVKAKGQYLSVSNTMSMTVRMEDFLNDLGVSSYEEFLEMLNENKMPLLDVSIDSLLQEHIDSLGPEYYVKKRNAKWIYLGKCTK